MYRPEEIRTVHLEMTSRCNASCPMCARNIHGGAVNPRLPLTELSLDDVKRIFPVSVVSQLKRIYLCGNYGDPMVARDTLEALEYFRATKAEIRLNLFTNGSARPESWWKRLAGITSSVHFGIDGIGDVSAIYRRGTSFETVIRNAKAFIDAGGVAQWDFIVFRHNEHQIEEARALSRELGFKGFCPKKTGRFFSNQRSQVKQTHEVKDSEGRVLYELEMPLAAEHRNPALERERELAERYGSLPSYLDRARVCCKVADEKSVYVSAEGLVFPCCWTANQLYTWWQAPGEAEIARLIDSLPGKTDDISALRRPIQEVVSGPFFQSLVPESWLRPTVKDGKLRVCAKTCGQEFDPFRAQF